MSPWEILVNIVGWFALVILGVMVLVVGFAIVVGVARGIRKWFPVKGKQPYPKGQLTSAALQDDYLEEATVVSQNTYKDDIIFGNLKEEAFQAGARWGWGFFSRK